MDWACAPDRVSLLALDLALVDNDVLVGRNRLEHHHDPDGHTVRVGQAVLDSPVAADSQEAVVVVAVEEDL